MDKGPGPLARSGDPAPYLLSAEKKMKQQKRYEGACYVGVVGAEDENGACRDSIQNINLRPGDSTPTWARGTKGFETRQMHLDKFMESPQFDFLLLLDHDMLFPVHTLERLRSHGLPYVSGLYMRRRFAPMAPIWFEPGPRSQLPLKWWTSVPEPDTLYKIGGSGWGCVLLHRDVVTAVRGQLKGEKEVLEDDMDLFPYDLARVMDAIKNLQSLATEMPARGIMAPALKHYTEVLTEEIRPLRGEKSSIVGSDVRFPFYAKLAGFDLYGDSGVQCGHDLHYPLMPADFAQSPEEARQELRRYTDQTYRQDRRKVAETLKALRGAA